jgi:hypothetical protein
MRAPNVQRYLLFGLIGLLVCVLAFRFGGEEPPREVPLKFTSTQHRAKAQASVGLDVKSLDTPARNAAAKPARNIFVAGAHALSVESPPSRLVAKKKKSVVTPIVEVAIAPPPASLPPPPPGPTPEELAAQAAAQQRELSLRQLKEQMGQYRYLGYLTHDGDHKAFIGKGHEIYIVREGDKLDGKFLVSGVDPAIVRIREAEHSLETTLPLKKS